VLTWGGPAARNRQLCWPTGDGGAGVDGQPPDAGAEPVGADDQVELAAAVVVEDDADRPVEVLQGPHGAAQPYRHALPQELVQFGPGQGQAGANIAPELVQVDVGEQAPAVVQ
jgi:hypothetical protein